MTKTIIDLNEILSPFSETQLSIAFRNIGAMELTSGCSVGCDFCGFEAKKGVKSRINWTDIQDITKRFKEELKVSKPFLYYATDPLDWKDGNQDYRDINDLFENVVGYHPYLSTAVPRGAEGLMHELLLAGKLDRVSISHMNFHRLKAFFEEKYPELKDHNFEIEELPDNVRKVHFTSEPSKHGEKAWLDLLRNLAKDKGQMYYALSENGGRSTKFRKLGSKNIEKLDPMGIACFHGTFLGNGGLYNHETLMTSRENPQGLVMTVLNPLNFNPYHLWRHPLLGVLNLIPDYQSREAFAFRQPLREFNQPILARDVKEEVEIVKKQSLLDSYAWGLAILEKYDCDLKRILNETSSMTLITLEAVIRMREKDYNIDSKSLNPNEPYDSRLLHARERYALAQKRIRPCLEIKK